ncbi:methyl-accepting chemotaxis protein [Salicola sp. Rm-C-2C1-2]|uniref:methyl-accepting chemotaxis protein n=1 Tax=Salicola sp. Rm-C-2C1-2 TaxID=3141321 RepID=UPI0032E38DBB
MKLQTRILLLAAVSALLVLWLAIDKNATNWTDYNSAKRVAAAEHVVEDGIPLISALQKERGKSMGFLASDSETLPADLRQQHDAVDESVEEFAESATQDAAALREHFQQQLQNLISQLQRLDDIRGPVEEKNLGTRDAATRYTELIHRIIRLFGVLPEDAMEAGAQEIALVSRGLMSVLFAKDATGLERGYITAYLAARDAGRDGRALRGAAQTALGSIESQLESAHLVLPQWAVDNLDEKVKQSSEAQALAQAREALYQAGRADLSQDAWWQMASAQISNYADFSHDTLSEMNTASAAIKQAELTMLIAMSLGSLLILALVMWLVWGVKDVGRILGAEPGQLRDIANAVARGDYNLEFGSNLPEGSVMLAVKNMVSSLHEAAKQAVFNAQIRSAMDGASTNVMIADNDRNVIYLNRAVQDMLRHVERDLQKDLPHFRADDVLNHSIDRFHKNPSHQMTLLENLTSQYTSNIKVGGRHFRLQANPIWGEQGERLGTVIEWLDRTVEVTASEEITAIVQAAAAGDFTRRATEDGKDGFFLEMAQGMNQLVATAEQGLNDVVRVLGEIANGNLTARIEADYEGTFGQLKAYTNQTADSLSEMLGEIRTAGETIATAANEIAQGNTDLSSRTEEQASNLEETASSMEQLTSTVKQNTDNARQANTLSDQATEVAQDGGELVAQVVSTMNEINESAQKIEEIIGVIDSIAFQTNILALNAAVEAARAGDQGRGFAVVASEVRSLAQRSANAAKDIKGLISDSVSKIQNGNQLVNQSGEKTQEIVTAIKRVSDINAEISAASEEQSSGIENINTAVSQMDEMTQQNAALVEEAAAASESQQSQVETLQRLLTRFTLQQAHRTSGSSKGTQTQLTQTNKRDQHQKTTAASTNKTQQTTEARDDDDDWETF